MLKIKESFTICYMCNGTGEINMDDRLFSCDRCSGHGFVIKKATIKKIKDKLTDVTYHR